jgi:phage terminase large subunit
VFAEIKKVIVNWGLSDKFNVRESDMTVTCYNGYQMLFAGLDDTEKLKSITPEQGVITDIRVEEATETSTDSLKQLAKRQRGGDPDIRKRLTLSFNPILKIHHIYTKYFAPLGWADDQTHYDDGRLSILKTWYIHNEFLTPDDVYDLENEEDSYWYDVYTLGNWGILGDVIFKNWQVRDLSDMANQFTNRHDGLDFGFGGSPAAYGSIHYNKAKREIYLFNEVYGREMTDDVLAGEVLPYCEGYYVTCDSAEPKAIATLINHGVKAIPAQKGPGSLEHGYRWLLAQTIIIDKSCINTQTELSLHQWAQDKDGNRLNKPQDKFNHMIAAMRYGLESQMLESQTNMRQIRVKGRGARAY